jgi:hypothetical protein
MSNFTSSGFRSTVSAVAALTITALMTWSIHVYAGYLQQISSPSLSTAQIESGTVTSDLDTQNG